MKQKGGVIESGVILAFGALCVWLAMSIPNNPVTRGDSGIINSLYEAKLFPLLAGGGITLLGLVMLVRALRGRGSAGALSRSELIRCAVLIGATAVYVFCALRFGFKVPTLLYLLAVLAYLNGRESKWYMIALWAVVFTVVGTVLVPLAINIPLP